MGNCGVFCCNMRRGVVNGGLQCVEDPVLLQRLRTVYKKMQR